MRKEEIIEGDFVHVVIRGAHGCSIIRDDADCWRILLNLLHFNDSSPVPNTWFRDLMDLKIANTFKRPPSWPDRKPLTAIIAFSLVGNHLHLYLKEITEGGISKFMHRLGTGIAGHFNSKYKEKGSLFQGPYRARIIRDDRYLRYVLAYIQVKNPFELYPGGYEKACNEFDKAYEWASNYPYCSLGDYEGKRNSPILDKDLLGEIFAEENFKSFAKDFLEGRNIKIFGEEEDVSFKDNEPVASVLQSCFIE